MFLLISGALFGNNVKIKSSAMILMFLLSAFFLFALCLASSSKEFSISINYAKAEQSLSLQTIIDNADPGSIINISTGVYVGGIVINKPLTIVGENPNDTVILGDGTGALVDVASDDVTFINFTLKNNGGYGIRIAGFKKIVIANNFVESNNQGIYIKYAQNINISGNKFGKNYKGVEISNSSNITIFENFFDESYGPGIFCYFSSSITVNSNVIINNYAYATYFEGVEDFGLYNNTVQYGCEGIHLLNCTNGMVTENSIFGTGPYGLTLEKSSEVSVDNCELVGNEYAFQVIDSWNNSVSGNSLVNNKFGLILVRSSYNDLVGNVMRENWWSFGVYGDQLEHYINYVDPSNSVNGEPVHYIVNRNQFEIVGEAGCVIIVNSSDAIVHNFRIESSYQGVVLAYSNNVTLADLDICNNFVGVFLYNTTNSLVTECNVNENLFGLWFSNASLNRIYLNNFIKNENFMFVNSRCIFDNGSAVGGNYWDAYAGVDCNHDGIGDTPYKVGSENVDNFPYMGAIYKFNVSGQHDVLVSTNSTIENFEYVDNGTLRFYLSPRNGQSFGFFRVRIPEALLYTENISVLIDDAENVIFGNFSILDDCTYKWIYFSYSGSSHKIEIIPEFSFIWMIFFFTFSIALTYLTKIKSCKK